MPHENDGRKDVGWQVEAAEPELGVEKEGDDEHQVDDLADQEEDVTEKRPLPPGTVKCRSKPSFQILPLVLFTAVFSAICEEEDGCEQS